MKKKEVLILVLTLFLFTFPKLAYAEINVTSPSENMYTSTGVENVRLNLDYVTPSENDSTMWIEIDNKRIEVRKNDFLPVEVDFRNLNLENSNDRIEWNKNVTNNFVYSGKIMITGKGTVNLTLIGEKNSQIALLYSGNNKKSMWSCLNGTEYSTIGEAKSDVYYSIEIDAHNNGIYFDYYDLLLITPNEENIEVRCNLEPTSKYFNATKLSVESTSSRLSEQSLNSGTYFFEVGSGNHTIKLVYEKDNTTSFVEKSFLVVIDGCGNLICDGEDSFNNCATDCEEVICKGSAFKGDLNYNNIIDEKDLEIMSNILAGRIPKPEGDCCVDLNDDESINIFDYNILKNILDGERIFERCSADCNDGTVSDSCSLEKPYYCSSLKTELIKDCKECGCPPYKICELDGECGSNNNFEIIIKNTLSNESKKYMKGGTIYTKSHINNTFDIVFSMLALKNLENVSFEMNLEESNIELKKVNNILAKKENITEGSYKDVVITVSVPSISLKGLHNGSIKVMINEYEFYIISIEVEIEEKIIMPTMSFEEKIFYDYRLLIPYIMLSVGMIIILIILIKKRKREKEYLM